MRRRNWDQLAAIFSLALLSGLAAATWYLALVANRADTAATAHAPAGEPDYFLDDAVFTRIDIHGNPTYRVSADHLQHFPEDDTSVYESPRLMSLDPQRPRVTVRALQGRSNADGTETLLTGDVVLVREASGNEPRMTVRTEKATVYTDTEIVTSDQPVRIERGTSVLTGVGMQFDNAARSLKVDSQVVLTVQPSEPKTSR